MRKTVFAKLAAIGDGQFFTVKIEVPDKPVKPVHNIRVEIDKFLGHETKAIPCVAVDGYIKVKVYDPDTTVPTAKPTTAPTAATVTDASAGTTVTATSANGGAAVAGLALACAAAFTAKKKE